MSNPEKVRDRIQALDERLARLRTEKNRLLARASHTERRRNTRRKILIGGAVLAAVEHEGVPALRSKAELLKWLNARLSRPHDRAAFDFEVQEPIAATGMGPAGDPKGQQARSEAAVRDAAS